MESDGCSDWSVRRKPRLRNSLRCHEGIRPEVGAFTLLQPIALGTEFELCESRYSSYLVVIGVISKALLGIESSAMHTEKHTDSTDPYFVSTPEHIAIDIARYQCMCCVYSTDTRI